MKNSEIVDLFVLSKKNERKVNNSGIDRCEKMKFDFELCKRKYGFNDK